MVVNISGSPALSSNTVPKKEETEAQDILPQDRVTLDTEVYNAAPKMPGGQQTTVNAIGPLPGWANCCWSSIKK